MGMSEEFQLLSKAPVDWIDNQEFSFQKWQVTDTMKFSLLLSDQTKETTSMNNLLLMISAKVNRVTTRRVMQTTAGLEWKAPEPRLQRRSTSFKNKKINKTGRYLVNLLATVP